MFTFVYEWSFGAGISAPENKYEMRASFIEIFNGSLGEDLPAFAAVRASPVRFHGEDIIKEEHALILPT